MNATDIVVGDQGIVGWVIGKTDAALKVLDHNGYTKIYTPPKVQILGQNGVLVVRNLFSLTGGADQAGSFATTLLPLLALGGGDDKIEKLIPFLLMSSTAPAAAGAAPAANPLQSILPLLLLKDGGLGGKGDSSLDKLLPILLLSGGGLGGGTAGGLNPLLLASLLGDGNSLFGNSTPAKLAPVATRGGVPVLQPGY